MVGVGQHRDVAVEDLFLHGKIELMVAPGGDDEVARSRLVILLDEGRCERGLAGAGERAALAEEGSYPFGTRIGEE